MSKTLRLVAILLGVPLGMGLGCASPAHTGGDGGGGPASCTPGQSAACACTDGQAGAQLCQLDGTFAPCVCEATGAPDAGADGGNGADGGGLDGGSVGGAVGAPCSRNADCASGACIFGGSAADGGLDYLCSEPCAGASDCPAGWACLPIQGAPTNLCSPLAGGSSSGGQTGDLTGQLVILGGQDPTGTRVQIQNANLTLGASADSQGGYLFSGVPSGAFSLGFQESVILPPDSGFPEGPDGGPPSIDYAATLPELLFLPGSDGFVVDNGLYPLGPIELPAGKQLASGEGGGSLLSPDGSALAYLADYSNNGGRITGTLYLLAVPGGTPVKLGTGVPQNPYGYQFSKDGLSLFYLASFNGSSGTLYAVAAAGGTPVQLGTGVPGFLDPNGYSYFQLTPDGSHAFYVTSGGTLYEVAVAGGTQVQLGNGVQYLNSSYFQLTPDGNHAFYVTSGGTLYEVAVVGGTPVQLGTGVPYLNSNTFQLTPDGSHAFYLASWAGNTGTLYEVAVAAGTQAQLGAAVPRFALSPDASQVAFIASSAGNAGGALEIAPVAGGTPLQLATAALGFSFSPDGRYLDCNLVNAFWNGKTSTSALVPTGGGAIVPINDFGSLTFAKGAVVFTRAGTPVPFDFEDGLYLTPLP